jgi:hypothetical protein
MKKIFIYGISLFAFFYISCNNDKINIPTTTSSFELLDSSFEEFNTKNNWHITNKRICVLFGYNFNSPEIQEKIIKSLDEKYGLDSENGLITPLFFPENFKHNGKSYATDLYNFLNKDENIFSAVILLGAPENTHIALARNQDFWNMNVPYPIIALFPQDDALGLESTCDFVIEKSQVAEIEGTILKEENETEFIIESPEILFETIDYLISYDSTFAKNSQLTLQINQIYKEKKLRHYIDPESGLQSINHFILD